MKEVEKKLTKKPAATPPMKGRIKLSRRRGRAAGKELYRSLLSSTVPHASTDFAGAFHETDAEGRAAALARGLTLLSHEPEPASGGRIRAVIASVLAALSEGLASVINPAHVFDVHRLVSGYLNPRKAWTGLRSTTFETRERAGKVHLMIQAESLSSGVKVMTASVCILHSGRMHVLQVVVSMLKYEEYEFRKSPPTDWVTVFVQIQSGEEGGEPAEEDPCFKPVLDAVARSTERIAFRSSVLRGYEVPTDSAKFIPIQEQLLHFRQEAYELRESALELRRASRAAEALKQQAEHAKEVAERRTRAAEAKLQELKHPRVPEPPRQLEVEHRAQPRLREIEEAAARLGRKLEEAELKVENVLDVNSALRAELYAAQRQIEALILAAEPSRCDVVAPVPNPESLDELESWAGQVLGERVLLHRSAITKAKESNYHNPGLVYDALRALANTYWPMVFEPSEESRSRWALRLEELHLDCSLVGTAPKMKTLYSAYEYQWEGKTYRMDKHLSGSSSFDPRFGLRIYFCVDRKHRRILVGSLPTHLPNRQSN